MIQKDDEEGAHNSISHMLAHAEHAKFVASYLVFAILSTELCRLILLKITLIREKIRENFYAPHSRNQFLGHNFLAAYRFYSLRRPMGITSHIYEADAIHF